MPNTYSQLYVHLVFAVKNRESLLLKPWRNEVFKYMNGILTNKNHKPIIINGVEDHAHIFMGLNPNESISNIARDLKNNSNRFIKESKFIDKQFNWSQGYGAFSVANQDIDRIYNYIKNQEEHHKKEKFESEYKFMLQEHQIEYKPEYLFQWIDLDGEDL